MRFEYDHTNLEDQRFMLVYGTFKIRRTLDITDTRHVSQVHPLKSIQLSVEVSLLVVSPTGTTILTSKSLFLVHNYKRNICVTIPYS